MLVCCYCGKVQNIVETKWQIKISEIHMKHIIGHQNSVRVTTIANTDRLRPFCQPFWLSIVWYCPYSNLNESLMEAVQIWNLEEIWLKITKLEWTRQLTLIGVGHFVGHLGYRLSNKTCIWTWTRVWWKQSIYEIWKKSNLND